MHRTSEEESLHFRPWVSNGRQYDLNPVAANEVQDKPDAVNQPLRFRVPSPSPSPPPSVELDTSDPFLINTPVSYSSVRVFESKLLRILAYFPKAADSGSQAQNEHVHQVSSADQVIQADSGESPMIVDEVGNHELSQRGKKRDRAEVDSTLGEDEDDTSELDADESILSRRKRQTFSRHEFDADVVASRNQKRDRHSNDNESDSDPENEMSHPLQKKSSKHKKPSKYSIRRKLSQHGDRAVGEEWVESNIKWKLGPNRELLRHDLIKQVDLADSTVSLHLLYSECVHLLFMFQPFDSDHMQRLLKPEIYVEKWFTIAEHTKAHGSCVLIGQENLQERFVKAQKRAFELNRELDRREVGISSL